MPVYDPAAASIDKPVLTEGRPITLWDAETVTGSPDPAESKQFCLHRNPNLPNCFSVELEFSANPGAFQLDVQTADTDEDKYYVTKASLSTGLNENFVGRIEVTNVVAKFARLKMITLTNAVEVTARVF